MKKAFLTALASYCNNPRCKWASLDEEANKEAKLLFEIWNQNNIWRNPWDGFLDIIKKEFPQAKSISRTSPGIAEFTFTWYGDTWTICDE